MDIDVGSVVLAIEWKVILLISFLYSTYEDYKKGVDS